MLVAIAILTSETRIAASFFDLLLSSSLLYRLQQFGTLRVLHLQTFDQLPAPRRQLKHYSEVFLVLSCLSFSLTDFDLTTIRWRDGYPRMSTLDLLVLPSCQQLMKMFPFDFSRF